MQTSQHQTGEWTNQVGKWLIKEATLVIQDRMDHTVRYKKDGDVEEIDYSQSGQRWVDDNKQRRTLRRTRKRRERRARRKAARAEFDLIASLATAGGS